MLSFLPYISHTDEAQCEVSQPQLPVIAQEVRTQDRHLDFLTEKVHILCYIYQIHAETKIHIQAQS